LKLKTKAKKTTSWWGRLTGYFKSGVKKLAVKAKKLKLRVKSVAKKVVKVSKKIHVKKIAKKANAGVKFMKGKFSLAKKLIKIQVKKVRAAKKVVVIRAKAKFLELKKILNVAKNLKFKVHKFRVIEATKRRAKRATKKAKKMLIRIKTGGVASFIHQAKMSVIKAKKTVKKLVKLSAAMVKKNIKSLYKQGGKLGIKVQIKMGCKCLPKVILKSPINKRKMSIMKPLNKVLN